MNPYPFALLNHFTVPFRRSTCAPPHFAGAVGFVEEFGLPQNMHALCGCRVALSRIRPTKTQVFSGLRVRESRAGLSSAFSPGLCEPENARDRLGVADQTLTNHP